MIIRNLVFDVGQVLVGYDPYYIVDKLLPGSPFRSKYVEHFFLTDLWHQLDKGTLEAKDVPEKIRFYFPAHEKLDAEIQLLVEGFVHHLSLIEDTKTLFMSLKDRYPLYILSNFQSDPFDKLIEKHRFMQHAKGIVVSAKVKMMKPEPEIYDYLLTTYKLNPSETLFIDDREENIEAAQDQGIHGIVFKNPKQLRKDLQDFGIEIQ